MPNWDERMRDVWDRSGDLSPEELVRVVDALVAELDPTDARGPFEAGGARDFAGREADAEPLYRRSLDLGLAGDDRERAVIQLASTLRNLGRPQEALDLLDEAIASGPRLIESMLGFKALALVDVGRPVEAARIAITTLASHVPEYNGAITRYARELTD